MADRKVLNKYYPPDYDPSKIPKLKGAKANRQWSIRVMAPFNMRCNTCGEYIYKGKKFNSKKETVEDEDYLGLHIFRFYIKCPRCVAEIAFKTDPQNTDYALEAGATRNFEAARTAEELAKKEIAAKEEEEANNPMKVLENRTKSSMAEMEMIETLEELKEMNSRHAKVDFESMLEKHKAYAEQLAKLQDEQDEAFVSSLFGKNADMVVKRLPDDEGGDSLPAKKKVAKGERPTDILTGGTSSDEVKKKPAAWNIKSIGASKSSLTGLVKPKSALAGLVKPKAAKPSSTTCKSETEDKEMSRSATEAKALEVCEGKETRITVNSDTKYTSKDNYKEQSSSSSGGLGGLGLLGNYSDSTSDSD